MFYDSCQQRDRKEIGRKFFALKEEIFEMFCERCEAPRRYNADINFVSCPEDRMEECMYITELTEIENHMNSFADIIKDYF